MAEDQGELNPRERRTGNGHRSSAEIHHEIQRTRAEIDRTLDALQEELRPRRLLWQARQRVEPEVRAAAAKVRDGVRRQAREDPKPLVAAGAAALGVLALAVLRRRRKRRKPAFPAEQKGV